MNSPDRFKPKIDGSNIKTILRKSSYSGWLMKYTTPTFSFMKSSKRQYIVLVDRMLYAFKDERPTKYKSFFELTANTHAYATDKFSGELYCIEIKKIGHDENSTWYLQADTSDSMKNWLNCIRKTVVWLKETDSQSNLIKRKDNVCMSSEQESSESITSFQEELDDQYSFEHYIRPTSSQSYSLFIPPPLPPPTSKLPPIPSYHYI